MENLQEKMRGKIFIWLFLMSLTLGCKDGIGRVGDNRFSPLPSPKANLAEHPKFSKEIFINELIREETFVENLSPGDRIHLFIKGHEIRPQFKNERKRAVERWTELVHLLAGKERDIDWQERKGSCELVYRRQEKDLRKPLLKEKGLAAYPLSLRIGKRRYSLAFTQISGSSFTAVLNITEEMLREGNKLYLEVEEGESLGWLQVGLLNYGNCLSHGRSDYHVEGNTRSHQVENKITYEFNVDLVLESFY